MNPLFNAIRLEVKKTIMTAIYGAKVNATLLKYAITKGY